MLMRRVVLAVAVIAATCAWAETGHAQATRTWISGVGDDANPCSRTAPCKTFAGAISKTSTNGEIDCLDPGGFGGLTITKAITIDCEAASNGGVLVGSTNGITVSTTGAVNLIGLDFNGIGPTGPAGLIGVSIVGGPTSVLIRNCKIYGFTAGGAAGIAVAPTVAGGNVVIDDVVITTNGVGILVDGSNGTVNVAVRHSTIMNNNNGIQVQTTGQHTGAAIENSTIDYNPGSGVLLSGGAAAAILLSNNTISGNGTGVKVSGGTGYTLKNNAIAGNGTDVSGTLSAYPGGLQ
jgi:hypothetical protein